MKNFIPKLKLFLIENKLIFFVIFLAAILRFYRIRDYMVYLGDEGRDDIVVYNILHGHLTFLGPTASVGGFFLGPIYYYFMAPFLWLSNYDPVGPSIMVALFSVATVWLIYYMGKEFFGKTAGLIGGFLYAISPLAIQYGKFSWNPNIVPFFSLLFIYLLYKASTKNSRALFLFAGVIFGVLLQLHYLTIFLGFVAAMYLVLAEISIKKQLKKRILTVFQRGILLFVGFLIGLSPFLLFEVRHQFLNTKNIITFIFYSKDTGGSVQLIPTFLSIFYRTFSRMVTFFPLPSDLHLYNQLILVLWGLLTICIIFASLYFLYKHKNKQQVLILTCYLAATILFGFYKKDIYDYYLELLWPLPFLLVGNAFAQLIANKKLQPLGKVLSVGVIIVCSGILLFFTPLKVEPNRLINQTQSIANFVLSKTDNKPYNFALITASNSDQAYRYFFLLADRNPVAILPPQIDPARTSVTSQLLIICEDLQCKPLGNALWEVAGFGADAKIADEWTLPEVKVYKLIHAK